MSLYRQPTKVNSSNKMTFYVTPEIREYFEREANYQHSSKSAVLQNLVNTAKPKRNVLHRFAEQLDLEIGKDLENTLKNIKQVPLREKSITKYQKVFE
jgi:hypothetical protein